ncbi:MAG TPA: DUF6402 family protein [Trinickia sp.]
MALPWFKPGPDSYVIFAAIPRAAQIVRMTTPNRIAYFKPEKAGFFSNETKWKKDVCKPLNNPQAHILMDRAPKGWTPPPLPPKAEEPKVENKAEKKPEKLLSDPPKPAALEKNKDDEDDDCRTPPPFDMLDLPDAMEKMGFHVAAKLARRWFNGRKYILPTKKTDPYPDDMIDTETVTLSFTLKYGGAEAKLRTLLNKSIYSVNATNALKKIVRRVVEQRFVDDGAAFSGDIDTWKLSGGKIQDFHKDYQFQLEKVADLETIDENGGLTDLTASLGNFYYLAALANATVHSEKYYKYTEPTPTFCCKSRVEVTHIYVYARDSYSFVDKPGGAASQYLGHWNRYGVIMVPSAVVADIINGSGEKGGDFQWGRHPDTPPLPLLYDNGFKKPVDVINGLFKRSLRRQDVYYPVYNSDYNAWREKYNRGGDFLIYSDRRKVKLPKPIRFTLEEVCKPAK